MEISSEKSKTMVISRDEIVHANIRMNIILNEILEEVDKFKYLEATLTKYGTVKNRSESVILNNIILLLHF